MRISEKRTPLRPLFWAIFMLSAPVLTAQMAQSPTGQESAPLPDAPVAQNRASERAESPPETDLAHTADVTILGTPKRVLLDEEQLVTSPFRLRVADARWLLPFAATTGVLIGTDAHSITLEHIDTVDRNRASKLTDGTVGLLGALPAGMFLWSSVRYAPLARETSLLTGESLGDAMILAGAGQAIFRRDRPTAGNGQGDFFSSSFSQAGFPSGHATAAWAMASVIGDEYPGWLPRTVVYTLAAATSVGRVVAEKHFPSDVVVGSALGWLVGHYVYRAHHQYDLTPFEEPPAPREYGKAVVKYGAKSATAAPAPSGMDPAAGAPSAAAAPAATVAVEAVPPAPATAATRSQPTQSVQRQSLYNLEEADPDTIGSTNVPMDSWVYPALERLGAMGFIPSQSVAIRPWTRIECERQVAEAADLIVGSDPDGGYFSKSELGEAERLLDPLEQEFGDRVRANESLALESLYARYGNIAGPALADSFHFGQTWWNDFGRPLGRGGSSILGFSGYATEGRMFLYGREEMQQGPGKPAYSDSVEQVIKNMDSNPVQTSMAMPSYVRYRPIELYAGIAFAGNALSFGKQELFWGPTTMGPLSFSSNAEPTYNLRFVSTRPHPLPFFPNLGTYRFDIVMGKLSGHVWPPRPWYNGQKANFNFGKNLEISFTRWSLLWGVGHGMSLHSLIDNLTSVTSTDFCGYSENCDAGARASDFDFRLRLPWLGNEVTLYTDGYVHDDLNPIDAPRRAVWNPGIYFARLPWLPHMDLRVEAASSEGLVQDFPCVAPVGMGVGVQLTPPPSTCGGQQFFWNNHYHDMTTNKGFMLGDAVGRDSRAEEGRIGWWVSAQTRVEAGYRQNKGGTQFLPGGSTISDGFVNARVQLSRHWSAQMFAQYERFLIPSYMTGAQSNKSGWFQLTWTPALEVRK
jgi:membrane-associated phospholipid phosphatase